MATIQGLMTDVSQLTGKISFQELVNTTTEFNVIPLDKNTKPDQDLINEIVRSTKNYISYTTRTRQRYEGRRINDVGKRIEEAFVEELKKSANLTPTLLGKTGYPDIKITDQNDRVTYLESKAISKSWESGFRSFYFTNGEKIESDARHLLIAWDIIEESPRYWKVNGWRLCDLSHLNNLNIKLEFNSNNKVLYSGDLDIASS
jgi:hypothetical protein